MSSTLTGSSTSTSSPTRTQTSNARRCAPTAIGLRSSANPEYAQWRNLGYQFMTLGSDKEEFVAPLREWYQRLYKLAEDSVSEKDKWMVVMLMMTFDHMFIMSKLGYHALTREEENNVIATIMQTAARHGLSMDSQTPDLAPKAGLI